MKSYHILLVEYTDGYYEHGIPRYCQMWHPRNDQVSDKANDELNSFLLDEALIDFKKNALIESKYPGAHANVDVLNGAGEEPVR